MLRSVLPCVLLALAVSACGSGDKPTPVAEADGPAGDVVAAPLFASFLKQNAADLDACFAGAPGMRGPGDTQSVSNPVRPVAVNRLVVAIDASGSMAGKIGGETKMAAAKRAASDFLAAVPSGTQVGLVAFGQRGNNRADGKAASCAGVDTIYPLGIADRPQIAAAMGKFEAVGWTPLAAAITRAGQSFAPSQTPGAQVVYIVSDGQETCGGDPVAAARALNAGPVKAVVNIIGFELTDADRTQLRAVAEAGGGSFVEAARPADLRRALDEARGRAVQAITTERFDAGARTTDNNMAAGRFTTNLNYCLSRGTSQESAGLQRWFAAHPPTPATREAMLAMLRQRHSGYTDRASAVAVELNGRRTIANQAIDTQSRTSEARLGTR